MFSKILHANDGSEYAFQALPLAIAIAKENNSELHMVSVEEIDYMPEFIEEVREETGTAARRFHTVLRRARVMAEEQQVKIHTHVVAGHARRHPAGCRSRHRIACDRGNRPFADLRAHAWDSGCSHRPYGAVSCVGCAVM
jgi:hypothetical protein